MSSSESPAVEVVLVPQDVVDAGAWNLRSDLPRGTPEFVLVPAGNANVVAWWEQHGDGRAAVSLHQAMTFGLLDMERLVDGTA